MNKAWYSANGAMLGGRGHAQRPAVQEAGVISPATASANASGGVAGRRAVCEALDMPDERCTDDAVGRFDTRCACPRAHRKEVALCARHREHGRAGQAVCVDCWQEGPFRCQRTIVGEVR